MGNRETSNLATKSDSGYGDDAASEISHDVKTEPMHPLARKGYDIGPASTLQIGDVFEFLWADSHEFEWEWKCLGYTRFIVLRHSDTFPHHCACIPISTGGKRDFAKPGIDASQQGYIFDDNRGYEQTEGRLSFSPVGLELRPGKLRVKEDSRANYADIIEIDHDAQVMIVGTVARYFDRVRRNVNKAFMRNIVRKALSEYKAGMLPGGGPTGAPSIRACDDSDEGGGRENLGNVDESDQEEIKVEGQRTIQQEQQMGRSGARQVPSAAPSEAGTMRRKHSDSDSIRSLRRGVSDSSSIYRGSGGGRVRGDDIDTRSMQNVAMAKFK
ncbi:uncharacterized protein BCR38DRAFT_402426 [Pseudomassariella vexata]|uniref:DUF6590 domain-containing protein n=1 Tax=Pseudomassariella vexata TaxID=1141098 RepID=A0A1Y2DAK5_9PEZI|nr:uncharacterized protein BCR38DRAFT_402426 [Pseudomassariella vexata]ORY56300.1 hypothetical protein BCR38DRAFT_402426 [Pseudomassariella vexata]